MRESYTSHTNRQLGEIFDDGTVSVNQELSNRFAGNSLSCYTVGCELNCSHEGFVGLYRCLSIRVGSCDDVPYRPRGSPAVESRRPKYICHLWRPSRRTGFGPSNHQCLERACPGIPAEQETPHSHLVCRCGYPSPFELSALAHFREIASLVLHRPNS